MTTLILAASTLRAVAVLAAAADSGCFEGSGRRVLLLTGTAPVPEAVPPVSAMPGFDGLRARFDAVVSWNEAIAPLHPADWVPRADDVPLWERHLRRAWGLADAPVALVLESLTTAPAQAVADIFTGAPIDAYTAGLDAYGPTAGKLPALTGTRVRRLLHTDPLPGLRPHLLAEFGARPCPVPASALAKVYAELASETPVLTGFQAPALLLGEGLAEAGLLPADEERELHLAMVRGAVASGFTRLAFAPDPGAAVPWVHELIEEAARLGVELTTRQAGPPGTSVLPEVLIDRLRPALVVGCASPALLTAASLYGIPVAVSGTGTLLKRLTPYENGARTAVTLTDALLPDLADPAAVVSGPPAVGPEAAGELADLLAAVAFAMRPRVRPDLRPAAERYLSTRLDGRTWRYFTRRRLTSLALPGAVPARLTAVRRNATVRRLARRARALSGGTGG
ncbi:alpha-2,8-polysialyltransferase family protein [Streptomyces halstedii]|uniref:polysialyltransferase family glycosyltransferase n=1 Tax=Streptomyces halstedii TaxID=1944 RepID=UPI00324F8AF7